MRREVFSQNVIAHITQFNKIHYYVTSYVTEGVTKFITFYFYGF